MFHLTKQERLVLGYLGCIFLFGISFQYAFKQFPRLNNIVNVLDSDALYRKLNVNTATEAELVRVPYIGTKTARRITGYRDQHGVFKSVEEILKINGINRSHYKKFKKYLKVLKGAE